MSKFLKLDCFDLQIEHIKNESEYDHNLYKVIGSYGDMFSYRPDTLFIKEDYHEFENCFEYTIFVKTNNQYVMVMNFVGEERIYEK